MLRPLSLLPALAVVVATLTGATTAEAATGTAEDAAPLEVTIDTMAPATVPKRGRITVTGSVTNVSEETWTGIDVYPFRSLDPLTTRSEIAEAAASDPTDPVGERVLDEGPYYSIDELAPGATARYTVRVRAQDLEAENPGVYWFGIHALGESPTFAADTTSDGRARTFLPKLGGSGRQVKTALVVPLREGLQYEPDGSLSDPGAWAASLSAGGALSDTVALGEAAGSRPLTFLLDPALAGAVERLAAGNPGRELGATVDPEASEDPDLPAAEGSPGAAATEEPDPGLPSTVEPSEAGSDEDPAEDPVEEPTADETAAAAAATGWLDDLGGVLSSQEVLSLPFGDLDVSAAADEDGAAYTRARERSGTAVPPGGGTSTPALNGPRGYLSPRAIELAADDETLIGSDLMFPELGAEAPAVATVNGRRMVLASSSTATGGPGPDDRLAGVALRQRILAEAAVRRLGRTQEPLVVVLPTGWAPDDADGFFTGLDQDWLDLTTVGDVLGGPAKALDPTLLAYPRGQATHQLEEQSFEAARQLTRAGSTLQYLLTRNDTIGAEVADQALSSLSLEHRSDAAMTRLGTDRSRDAIETALRGVRISGPPKVTLSSASGRFSATLENTLDQPVTVRVRAVAQEPITISMAEQDVRLPPHSRRSVLLTAATDQQGVHRVTLQVTDISGTALGSSDELPIRAAQVSDVIWLIIGTGAALLFGAIGLRLVRRVRGNRRTPDAAAVEAPEQTPAPA